MYYGRYPATCYGNRSRRCSKTPEFSYLTRPMLFLWSFSTRWTPSVGTSLFSTERWRRPTLPNICSAKPSRARPLFLGEEIVPTCALLYFHGKLYRSSDLKPYEYVEHCEKQTDNVAVFCRVSSSCCYHVYGGLQCVSFAASVMLAFNEYATVKKVVRALPAVGIGTKYGIPQSR